MERIYLDNNATTPMLPEVVEAMLPYLSGPGGNPSSLHHEGRAARRAIESARETIAALLDAEPNQLVFTSGGTESNNLAVFGYAGRGPVSVVTSAIEHPSVLDCFAALEHRAASVERVEVNRCGLVEPDAVRNLLRPDARLVSVMLANNETGAIQPVRELAEIACERGIPFHTDAVQAIGRMPVSFRQLGVSSLSFSAHKFHGPQGVGGLIVARRGEIEPHLAGGRQELGLRPGTTPTALVIGMAKALEWSLANIEVAITRMKELRDHLERELCGYFRNAQLNGPATKRLANTLNLRFDDTDAQAAVIALDLAGLAVSTGSACASGAAEPSHALLAMGLSTRQARSSIRFSLSRLTTARDVERAIELVVRTVGDTISMSSNATPMTQFSARHLVEVPLS